MPCKTGSGQAAVVLALSLILGLQLGAAWMIRFGERPPVAPVLGSLPAEIGPWSLASEQALEPDVVAYLRPDDYIDRNYQGSGAAGQINLFVAWFKSLKSGYGPHSPAVCLPGAGWKPVGFQVTRIRVPGRVEEIPANQYILEKDNQNMLVLYWYENERRIWAEEFRAKMYMLPDLVRYHRSDVALVRVITPVDRSAVEAAKAGMFDFVRTAFPLLVERFSSL
jgi:EpsI family protein